MPPIKNINELPQALDRLGVDDIPISKQGKNGPISGTSKLILGRGDATRPMVVKDFDGVKVPFYNSSGNGGKASVASGRWYPILGVTNTADLDTLTPLPDGRYNAQGGWFNKGSEDEINDYYGSQKLRDFGHQLDAELGDLSDNWGSAGHPGYVPNKIHNEIYDMAENQRKAGVVGPVSLLSGAKKAEDYSAVSWDHINQDMNPLQVSGTSSSTKRDASITPEGQLRSEQIKDLREKLGEPLPDEHSAERNANGVATDPYRRRFERDQADRAEVKRLQAHFDTGGVPEDRIPQRLKDPIQSGVGLAPPGKFDTGSVPEDRMPKRMESPIQTGQSTVSRQDSGTSKKSSSPGRTSATDEDLPISKKANTEYKRMMDEQKAKSGGLAADAATPSQAAAPSQNSAREAAEKLRAQAAESRQATSAVPTAGLKGEGNPPRPTTPSPRNQTQAEMEERQRAEAKKKYDQLANSDNPKHRAMAEKLKARAEGGRVIKDGKDVGTAAEQAGSTIPKVSDSPAQAAKKVASTPSVPAAASQQTGTAAARSAPAAGQRASAPGRGSAASVADEVDNAFNNVTGDGSESRKALGTGRPSDRKALGTGAEAARSAPSSSPTGELARRQPETGALAVRRGEAATADAEARQARRAAGGSGRPGPGGAAAFPSSPAAGAAPAGSGAATASRAAAGGGVGGGAAATAGGAGAPGGAGGTGARGGAGAAAGRATRGSRTNGMLRGMAYNSSLIDRELDLTTRGFVAGIGSIANDLGLNRRVTAYGADGKPSSYMDTFFGTTIRGGTGYAHPLMDDAGRVSWTTARTVQAATAGWGKHIEDSFQSSTGIMKVMTGIRRSLYNGLGGGSDGFINKMLTRLGGAGTLVAPVLMGVTAIADFRQGYKKGGVFGGIAGAGKGIVAGWIMNKVVAAALLNPVTTLIAGGAIAAAAYATYKIFDVRNQGNNYLRQRQMQGPSWKTGPSAGMSSSMGNTIRQRSMHAMENSRFNAMRSMGNESYMITAPKSRYANSTTIHSTAPMLSY